MKVDTKLINRRIYNICHRNNKIYSYPNCHYDELTNAIIPYESKTKIMNLRRRNSI